MSDPITPRTYTVVRRDGTASIYTLLAPGTFTRHLRTSPVETAVALNRRSTKEIRIVARGCRELALLHGVEVPPELRWWESVLGPQPDPERGLFEDD